MFSRQLTLVRGFRNGQRSCVGAFRDMTSASTTAPKEKKPQPMCTLSPELAAVVGKGIASRQDALKGVWAYIKANDLQDPQNKRSINADAALQAVFKQETATMYEVMKLMSPHVHKQE